MPTTFLRLVCAVVLLLPAAVAAKPDPVTWSAAVRERQADGTIVLEVAARIERGWYIYGMRQPEDGPAPLRFRAAVGSGAAVGPVRTPLPRVSYDRGFRARVGKHYDTPSFFVPVRLSRTASKVAIDVRYQACNDEICLPPRTVAVQTDLPAGS
ncbi:MAG TPA: protein-disulfide reductase DsbD domain-containing protein [Gemmatimonadaceae bacterium]|nr:protein-disulfide reductase DsbD domain-containing protein [Gemmatimonadaceae bacterium]